MENLKPHESLLKVLKQVELLSIQLIKYNSEIMVSPDLFVVNDYKVEYKYSEIHFEPNVDSTRLLVFIGMIVEMSFTDEKFEEYKPIMQLQDKFIGRIELKFCITYSMKDYKEINEEGLNIFTKTNSVYNLYPYLRSHISEACLKMGVPAVTLPMMRPPTHQQIDSYFSKKVEN